MTTTPLDAGPIPLFTLRLEPLGGRLSDQEAVAYASAIAESREVLTDPRLADALLQVMYANPLRLLLTWPDGALGFAFFPPGKHVPDAVAEGYAAARDVLETIHLQHQPPTGVQH